MKHGRIVVAILSFCSTVILFVRFHAGFKSKLDTSLVKKKEHDVHMSRYIDAYNICCGTRSPKSAQVVCKKEDGEWFDRLVHKSPLVSAGGATLYWAHMRKVCN